MATATWKMHKGYGEGNPWVAEITGTDERYTFSREFLKATDREFSKSGRTGTYIFEIPEEGLFEDSTGEFTLRWQFSKDGETKQGSLVIDKNRAYKIAKILDLGLTFKVARIATVADEKITDANRENVLNARQEVQMAEALKND